MSLHVHKSTYLHFAPDTISLADHGFPKHALTTPEMNYHCQGLGKFCSRLKPGVLRQQIWTGRAKPLRGKVMVLTGKHSRHTTQCTGHETIVCLRKHSLSWGGAQRERDEDSREIGERPLETGERLLRQGWSSKRKGSGW